MNSYIYALNLKDGSANIKSKYSSDDTKIKILDDEDSLILIDGYFLNEREFANQYSSKSKIKFEELLLSLSKRNIRYEQDLEGSFSIIFFDKKNIVLKFISDYWGSRPTYYFKKDSMSYISNDLYFLKKKLNIKVTPNIKKIKELLAWQNIDDSSTFYNEIDNIKGGSILTISQKSVKHEFFSIFDKQKKFPAYDEITFQKVFETAVHKRSSKFNYITVMLSGGLDSSAVAVALKNSLSKNIETISANFSHIDDSSETDEARYQKFVSDFTKFNENHVEMKGKSILEDIDKYIHIFQEPVILPNLYMFELICKNLERTKIDSIFDGNDGDSVISYGFEDIFKYFTSFRFVSFFKAVSAYAQVHRKSKKSMFHFFLRNTAKKIFKLNGKVENKTLLLENIFKSVQKNQTRSIFDSHKSNLENNLHKISFNYRYKIFSRLGIECVSPFYDKDLIDFCTQMPSKFKFNKGYTRYILRKYLNKYLPHEHAFRPSKSNLAKGLESNFSEQDIKIVLKERNNINKRLLKLIEVREIDAICYKWQKNREITEEDIINLQIFLNINIFLNSFFD